MVRVPLHTVVRLDGFSLTLDDVERVARASHPPRVVLTAVARSQMTRARALVRRVLRDHRTVYGINTGFGRMADVKIGPEALRQLQRNLILSHAAGVGPACARDEVRAMILLRLNLLARGHSGVRIELARRLIGFLDNDLCPVIPRRGSVGASGDLAPMAHMALAVIGEGMVDLAGRRMPSRRALKRLGWHPMALEAKEGLALINGVQASTALLGLALVDMRRLMAAQDVVCALTALAVGARPESFDERLARARPHPGQLHSTQSIAAWLGRSLEQEEPRRVQDPYSVRCAPQVHGVCWEAIDSAFGVCNREINAATDNPLLFPETGDVLAGGNFHGAPVGHAADRCAVAACDAAAISERRAALLLNADFNLATPFLTPPGGEGLNSGLMMWQVTAAALVSEMKTLAHPASVDSIPTSLGQEDHVSMSFWAADKLREAVDRWRYVLAIEALAAWRALALRRRLPRRGPLKRVVDAIGAIHGRDMSDRSLGTVVERIGRELDLFGAWRPGRG